MVENKNSDIAAFITNDTSIIENFLKDKALSDNMNKIMIEIYKNPRITVSQMKNFINISPTSINNNISKLKELGLLKRVGTRKVGYWSIIDLDK